jgi:hypothetical protein
MTEPAMNQRRLDDLQEVIQADIKAGLCIGTGLGLVSAAGMDGRNLQGSARKGV